MNFWLENTKTVFNSNPRVDFERHFEGTKGNKNFFSFSYIFIDGIKWNKNGIYICDYMIVYKYQFKPTMTKKDKVKAKII